jgi:hypothetical protein
MIFCRSCKRRDETCLYAEAFQNESRTAILLT